MTHFSILDGGITKSIACPLLLTNSEPPNIIGCLGEYASNLSSRAEFLFARLCRNSLILSSQSRSLWPPVFWLQLWNPSASYGRFYPLDSNTYNSLVPHHCCCYWCCCGFLALSYSPLSASTCPLPCFFCPTASLSSLQNPLQQCLQPCRHPFWARVTSHGDLLQQALLGAGLRSRKWL